MTPQKRLHAVVTAALLTLLAFSAELRAQNDVVYEEKFDGYGANANPIGWVDSTVGQVAGRRRAVNAPGGSMYRTAPDPSDARNIVYGARSAAGDAQGTTSRFGTFSTMTAASFAGTLDLTGRFFRGAHATRLGIAFFSSYPEKDRYYLIGLAPQNGAKLTMQLSSHGAGTIGGTTDSAYAPEANVWYRFHISVDASGTETGIRARFWIDGGAEPASDSIIAADGDTRRLRGGRIGMWSAVSGAAYVDDLSARSARPTGAVDATPPVITLFESGVRVDLSSHPSFGRDVAFEIHVDDDSAFTVQSTIDGAPYTSLATVSGEGTHTLRVAATDVFGNATEVTLTFAIVRIAGQPQITITSPAANQTIGTARVVVSGTVENAATVTVNGVNARVDLAAKTFSSPEVALLEGANTITVVAGNTEGGTATATLAIVVDTRPPDLTISAPVANACLDVTAIDVRGRAFDPALRSVKVIVGTASIDAAIAADSTWSASIPATSESTYSLNVVATDSLGHSSSATIIVTIDRTPPVIVVTEAGLPFEGMVTNRNLTLLPGTTETDARTAVTSTLDGAPYTTGTAVSAEGDHELKVVATDCAGHTSQKVVRFTIDRTPPRLVSIAPQAGTTLGSRTAITGTASPDATTITMQPLGKTAPVTNGEFTLSDLPLAEGDNPFMISLVDRAGNTSETPYRVTLKSTTPQIEITDNGTNITPGTLFNRAVTPVFRATEPEAKIMAALNGQPFAPGAAISADGDYTLIATATDSLGHSSQATATFTIDRTPPAVKITSPREGDTITTDTVEVRGTVSADASLSAINGVAAAVTNGSFTLTVPLEAGPNELLALARDRAGNVAVDRIGLTRAGGPRGIILTSPPDRMVTNRSTAVVSGQVLTASSDAKVTIGGAEVPVDAGGAFRKNDFTLAEGENVIVVSVRTAAGEMNQVSVRVTADRTPPRLRLLESGQLLSDGARFADQAVITAEGTDAGQTVPAQLTVDGAAAAQPLTINAAGGHTIVAVVRDTAGNEARVERTVFVGANGVAGCALGSFDPPAGSVVTARTMTVTGRSGGAAGVKINGVAAFVANGSFCSTVELPVEGDNAVSIVCTDAGGNASGEPVTLVLRRITGDPSITITAPGEGSVVATNVVTVTGTTGAGVSSVDVNGVAALMSGGSFTATGVRLTAGLNIVVARAHSAAGRISSASRRVIVMKDAPALTITSPAASLTTGASRIDFSGGWSNLDPSTINVAGVTAQSVALSDSSGTFIARDVPLGAGPQTLTVNGRDALGRTATASVTVTMNGGAPSITITEPADNAVFGAAAGATFTVRGSFTAAPGPSVDVAGVPATIAGSSFTASVPFSTLPSGLTPVIARVTEPSGTTSIDSIRIQKLASAPRIVEAFPSPNAVEIEPGALSLVLFSSPMDRVSLASAFRLETSAGTPVTGMLRLERDVLTFAPAALLTNGASYTIRVAAGSRDIAGNLLGSEFSSTFAVAATAPGTPPAVVPVDAAVCAQQKEIRGTAPAGARVRLDYGPIVLNTTATPAGAFTFQLPLSGQSGCQVARVRVAGSDGSLSPATEVRFQVDCNGPHVTGAAFDRPSNRLSITFSKDIKASTLVAGQGGSILLQLSDGRFVAGTAGVQSNVVTITPAEDLGQKSFTLSITTAVEDTTGAKLAFAHAQAFTFDSDQPPVSSNGLGFISGEVYDGTTGRPLSGASVLIEVGSTSTLTSTDARGRYAAQVPEGAHTIRISAAGFVTVWRQIIVTAGSGVIPIDVRLAKKGSTGTVANGETVLTHGIAGMTGLAPAELRIASGAVAAGKTISLTSLGPQSLPGLLPLAWSGLACAAVDSDAPSLSGTQLTFTVNATDVTAAAQTVTAVQYHDDRDEWQVIVPVVIVGTDGRVTLPIAAPGTFALVYGDRAPGLVRPPVPVTNAVLQGVADPCATATCPPLAAKSFAINPPVILPTGRSVATLKIDGLPPAIFPSGTAVQAYVGEELQLADGSRISDPPFTTDILLYRNLVGDTGVAEMQLAPSPKAAEVVLQVGFDHIRILPYPGRLDRGTSIGPEGGRVPGDGRVSIDVSAGSTTEALRATSTTLTDFGAFGSIAGFNIAGGFTLSLQRANGELKSAVELITPARVTFAGITSASQHILVEVLDNTPYGRLYRLAAQILALGGGRMTTKPIDRSVLPLAGVVRDGRYLLLAANAPLAFATGAVRVPNSTTVANARVLAPPLGVADFTRAGGVFCVPVPAAPAPPFTLVPRSAATGDGSTYTHSTSPPSDAIVHVADLALVLQSPSLTSTIPAANAGDTPVTTIVKATFSPAIDPQSVNGNSISVVDGGSGVLINGRVTAEGSTAVVWTLPPGERLLPNKRYTATVAASIRGTNGAPFGRNYAFTFSTPAQLVSGEVHREKIRITIPDANGRSRIVGDPAALPAGWQAVAVRRGRDFSPQPQATAAIDGSFVIDLPGRTSIDDLIDLQVINSAGSMAALFALTPFVAEDGKSFVAPPDRDTHFTSADGRAGVAVPSGAFDEPTTITVTPADRTAFAAVPNIDKELGFAGAVKIDFPGVAKKRLEIEIAAPAGASPSTPYYLARLGESVLGPRMEVVDTLRLDNGKLTTTLGSGSAATSAITRALRPGTNATFGDPQQAKNAMIATLRGGIYDATRFLNGQTWLLIDSPLGGAGFDLFSSSNESIFLSGFSLTEKRGRALFPVRANTPFQLVGYDSSTGLEMFRFDRQGADALDPLNAIPTSIITASDSGPYPVFTTPGRLEIVTVPSEGVTLTSVRGLEISQQNGQVTVTAPAGASSSTNPRVDVLNITNANSASTSIGSGQSAQFSGAPGDRLLITIAEENVDPEQTIVVAFSSRIDLQAASTEDQIDQYLHQRDWISILGGENAAALTAVTAQARFSVDPDARRVIVHLPLQRGKLYRVVIRGNLSGPPVGGQPGLKLGQRNINGQLVPSQPNDIRFDFTTRAPGGEVGRMLLPDGKGGIRDFAQIGNVALIATTGGGLQAFDISDPAKFSSIPPPAPIRVVDGAADYWSVTADRHGRIFAAGLTSTFAVVQSFRLESFIDPLPGAGSPPPIQPVGGANVAWRLGVNTGVPIGTDVLITDRPEAIPRKLQVVIQDAEQLVTRAQLEQRAVPGSAQPLGDFRRMDVAMSVPASLPYYKQRITIENRTAAARWSADVQRGATGVIRSVIARDDDELYIVRNTTTYGVVSLFGYGIGVFDLNAVESNDVGINQPGYAEVSERVVLTAAKGDPRMDVVYPETVLCSPNLAPNTPCTCDPGLTAPTGAVCEIRDLTFSPDALIFPSAANSALDVYALDQRRGLLDMRVTPPRQDPNPPGAIAPAQTTMGSGLSFSDPFVGASGAGNLYHPRLRSLNNLYVANGSSNGIPPRARFTSVSPYLRTDTNGNPENFALVAANTFGLLIVKLDGTPLRWESLVDVIWIPAGALSVRVIPRSDLALVVDNAGRILIVDLRQIDESSRVLALPSCSSALCIAELFPTAKQSINGQTPPLPIGADWIEVGVDDPRIVWKSGVKAVIGNIAPLIDPDTGILISGDINGNRVSAIAAIDPRIQFRIRADNGPRYVNSITPLGIAPKDPATNPESSYGAFRVELTLPGSIAESLAAPNQELRLAVESERVVGAVTEQTPDPLPPAHLRQNARNGAPDPRAASFSEFRMQRLFPYSANDPQLRLVRYQRAYNRFVSPWIVAIADPRASEKFQWGNISRVSQGCFACERPASLRGRNAPDVYELLTRGRVISVRPESNVFANSKYQYLGDANRLIARAATIMADTVRSPEVLVAAQNPPVAGGMLQETTYLHSGEVETSAVDLDAGGRNGVGVVIARSYRSRSIGFGALGPSWDAPMFKRLREMPNGAVEYRDGAGGLWQFKPAGGSAYVAPRGLFLALASNGNGWSLSDQRKRISSFDKLGRLTRDADEFFDAQNGSGNAIDYLYDVTGRLATIVDPVARTTRLDYYESVAFDGLLKSITDWRNRKLVYEYDSKQRLTEIKLPAVTNADGSQPRRRYGYVQAPLSYNDRIELDKELASITEPHEALTSGPARVSFDYELAGPNRDRVKSQTWGTGETASFAYAGGQVTVVDALRQERVFTIAGTGLNAHITGISEKGVMASNTPFGELPRALVAGAVEAAPRDRTWTLTYDADGMATTSTLAGVSRTENLFVPATGAPGLVPVSSKTSSPGGQQEIERRFAYSQAAFLKSVSAGSLTVDVTEPTRSNISQNAQPLATFNDQIQTTSKFDGSGRVVETQSSGGTVAGAGSALKYTYKGNNSPQLFERGEIASVEATGLITTYQYSDSSTTVIDPRSISTTVEYDAWRRPVHVVKSGAQLTTDERFEYDASGRVVKQIEQKGSDVVSTKYTYDALGRQTSVARDNVAVAGAPATVTTRTQYDVANRRISTTLPTNGTVTRELDGVGRTSREVTATGANPIEHRYAYDLAGNRVYATDMLTAVGSAFDVHGRQIATMNADGTRSSSTYDEWGRPARVQTVSAGGSTIEQAKFDFTATGRLKSSETATGSANPRKTSVGWDGAGRTAAIEVAGRALHKSFDASGRLLASVEGAGSLTSMSTAFINQTFTSHAGWLPQQIASQEKNGPSYNTGREYDTNANVTREAVGNTLEWKQKFDELNNVVSAAQPQRPAATYDYDSRGAVTKETMPDGARNGYQYDATGALARYTDPVSEETRVEADLIGRPLKRVYVDGTIETFSYESERLKQFMDRQGRTQVFTYDDHGQLTRIDRLGSPQLDGLEYDDAGRLVRWTNKDSSVTWENFNLDGQPQKTTLTVFRNGSGLGLKLIAGVFEQQHSWDEHGERTEWTMPRPLNFAGAPPWTDRVREKRDAMANVVSTERTMFGSSSFTPLLTAGYRNAARPNRRDVFTSCGITNCTPASVVRQYDYDAGTGMLDGMSVSTGPVVIAGTRITDFSGLQIAGAQILGVSGGARSQHWSYDDRSRLETATNGRESRQNLTPADFRKAIDRTPRFDAATRATLASRGIDVNRIDPPSQRAGEATGHKIDNVIDGASVRAFSYNGSERKDDGKFAYEWDEKGRLIRAAEQIGTPAPLAILRVSYGYDGNDRMISRLVETARTSTPNQWQPATASVLTDGIPADAIFVWDPITDRLVSVYDANTGALSRQMLHGGLGYDDPIEITFTEPANPSQVNRLYPIYDEAGAGHLQAVLNASGEVVSRKVVADAYGDDTFSIAGAAVDLVQLTAHTDSAGAPSTIEVTLRSTEELRASTVVAGVRLAAVDATGRPLRTASVQPSLAGSNTARFTLTANEWSTLTANAAGVSIAATKDLRATAWGATLPVLPAPVWATATRPVFTSSDLPVEVRESLTNLLQWLASAGPNTTRTTTLYEVKDLALIGSDAISDDPARFIVSSPFHALPFFDSFTRLSQVRARWLDHATGTFLTPDPVGYRDSSNLFAFCAGDPVNRRDPSGELTIVVPGTWAKPNDWLPNGDFENAVSERFHEKAVVFRWSGGNTQGARAEAARQLNAFIAARLKPGERLNILAHSHGGNVVKLYTDAHGAKTIDTFIAMGTPQRSDYEINKGRVRSYINVYSNGDEVQIKGDQWWAAVGNRAGRTDPAAYNVNVTYATGRPAGVGHSELHTREVLEQVPDIQPP